MTIRLFNTLTKTKEDFAPIDAKNVRMYVCGPTVYDFAHIGNARPAIVFDVLYRLLRHTYGADHVTYVRNITDVDDKINARALRDFPNLPLNEAIRAVTEKTEKQYHADVAALGCLSPSHEPRATENIPGMIAIIQQLIERGHAYQAGGEVLFDIQSMPDYGALSRRKLDEQQAGARVAVDAHKKHPHDFVQWKLSAENEPGWESPWGRGRPGWHIECSAMSAAYLGNTFDIHGGGLDLIFPHHENEIAQSRCAHGTPVMANVWMHNGFLQVEGEKMSKSLGNFVTIRELMQGWRGQAWSGPVLKLAMLKTHYRQPINWSLQSLQETQVELARWIATITRYNITGVLPPDEKRPRLSDDFLLALRDDLNVPEAFASLREVHANASKGDAEAAYRLAIHLDFLGVIVWDCLGSYIQGVSGYGISAQELLDNTGLGEQFKIALLNNDIELQKNIGRQLEDAGLGALIRDGKVMLERLGGGFDPMEDEISNLISARNAARAAKNFAESDRIRDELLAQGIVLKDGPTGTTWESK